LCWLHECPELSAGRSGRSRTPSKRTTSHSATTGCAHSPDQWFPRETHYLLGKTSTCSLSRDPKLV
jgi:hypothetical protein